MLCTKKTLMIALVVWFTLNNLAELEASSKFEFPHDMEAAFSSHVPGLPSSNSRSHENLGSQYMKGLEIEGVPCKKSQSAGSMSTSSSFKEQNRKTLGPPPPSTISGTDFTSLFNAHSGLKPWQSKKSSAPKTTASQGKSRLDVPRQSPESSLESDNMLTTLERFIDSDPDINHAAIDPHLAVLNAEQQSEPKFSSKDSPIVSKNLRQQENSSTLNLDPGSELKSIVRDSPPAIPRTNLESHKLHIVGSEKTIQDKSRAPKVSPAGSNAEATDRISSTPLSAALNAEQDGKPKVSNQDLPIVSKHSPEQEAPSTLRLDQGSELESLVRDSPPAISRIDLESHKLPMVGPEKTIQNKSGSLEVSPAGSNAEATDRTLASSLSAVLNAEQHGEPKDLSKDSLVVSKHLPEQEESSTLNLDQGSELKSIVRDSPPAISRVDLESHKLPMVAPEKTIQDNSGAREVSAAGSNAEAQTTDHTSAASLSVVLSAEQDGGLKVSSKDLHIVSKHSSEQEGSALLKLDRGARGDDIQDQSPTLEASPTRSNGQDRDRISAASPSRSSFPPILTVKHDEPSNQSLRDEPLSMLDNGSRKYARLRISLVDPGIDNAQVGGTVHGTHSPSGPSNKVDLDANMLRAAGADVKLSGTLHQDLHDENELPPQRSEKHEPGDIKLSSDSVSQTTGMMQSTSVNSEIDNAQKSQSSSPSLAPLLKFSDLARGTSEKLDRLEDTWESLGDVLKHTASSPSSPTSTDGFDSEDEASLLKYIAPSPSSPTSTDGFDSEDEASLLKYIASRPPTPMSTDGFDSEDDASSPKPILPSAKELENLIQDHKSKLYADIENIHVLREPSTHIQDSNTLTTVAESSPSSAMNPDINSSLNLGLQALKSDTHSGSRAMKSDTHSGSRAMKSDTTSGPQGIKSDTSSGSREMKSDTKTGSQTYSQSTIRKVLRWMIKQLKKITPSYFIDLMRQFSSKKTSVSEVHSNLESHHLSDEDVPSLEWEKMIEKIEGDKATRKARFEGAANFFNADEPAEEAAVGNPQVTATFEFPAKVFGPESLMRGYVPSKEDLTKVLEKPPAHVDSSPPLKDPASYKKKGKRKDSLTIRILLAMISFHRAAKKRIPEILESIRVWGKQKYTSLQQHRLVLSNFYRLPQIFIHFRRNFPKGI